MSTQSNAEFFAPFVDGTIEDFCTREVQALDADVEHVQIMAFAAALGGIALF